MHRHMGRDWISGDDGSIDFMALVRTGIVWPIQRASTLLSVVPGKRKVSKHTLGQLDVAPGSSVPNDLENHNYSMSEVQAGLAVFPVVAIVPDLGKPHDNLDTGYEQCQAGCMPLDLVLAMRVADNTAS